MGSPTPCILLRETEERVAVMLRSLEMQADKREMDRNECLDLVLEIRRQVCKWRRAAALIGEGRETLQGEIPLQQLRVTALDKDLRRKEEGIQRKTLENEMLSIEIARLERQLSLAQPPYP